MYNSVKEFFEEEQAWLVASLENSGAFWPRVKNNTISSEELAQTKSIARKFGAVYSACEALIDGRLAGKISNPS